MLSGEFYTRLDYLYNGDANNSASLDPRAETSSYGITNLRLGWQNSQWDLALWGKNLSDKNAVAQTAPANIHTQVDRNVGAAEGSYQAFTIPPRSIGLTARRYF
jgi:outer membrane receptor protein involved in Fe transport